MLRRLWRIQMAKFKDKFIVINRNAFAKNGVPDHITDAFKVLLGKIEEYVPNNKYYVCNQDEPYAQKVIDTILSGEDEKQQ